MTITRNMEEKAKKARNWRYNFEDEASYILNISYASAPTGDFDLDGTLLDTIEGIRAAINEALRQCGYDYGFDKEETKTLIGDGADALVHRALKEEDTPEHFQTLKKAYMPLYRSEQESRTFLFPI